MKIVYSWLKDFVDIDVPAEELADALTSSGLEVASIVHRRTPAGIVAARVLEKEKHPNADKLSVCKVDAGTGEPLTIVCGAPNVAAGMLVGDVGADVEALGHGPAEPRHRLVVSLCRYQHFSSQAGS